MLRHFFAVQRAPFTPTLLRPLSLRQAQTETTKSFIKMNDDGTPEVHISIPIPQRVHRPDEDLATKKARLLYQSRKRGILESDLLCSTFVKKYLDDMAEMEVDQLDKLLDENDWDLYYWASGERAIPERLHDNEILKRMKEHFKNDGKQIIRMPKLDL